MKKTVVLALVAFWALMTNHCGIELITDLDFLACSPQTQDAPHQPSDCGDENDACATVESGLYRAEENQICLDNPAASAIAPILALSSSFVDLGIPPIEHSQIVTPPDISRIWQFVLRTALPPRAPSLAS